MRFAYWRALSIAAFLVCCSSLAAAQTAGEQAAAVKETPSPYSACVNEALGKKLPTLSRTPEQLPIQLQLLALPQDPIYAACQDKDGKSREAFRSVYCGHRADVLQELDTKKLPQKDTILNFLAIADRHEIPLKESYACLTKASGSTLDTLNIFMESCKTQILQDTARMGAFGKGRSFGADIPMKAVALRTRYLYHVQKCVADDTLFVGSAAADKKTYPACISAAIAGHIGSINTAISGKLAEIKDPQHVIYKSCDALPEQSDNAFYTLFCAVESRAKQAAMPEKLRWLADSLRSEKTSGLKFNPLAKPSACLMTPSFAVADADVLKTCEGDIADARAALISVAEKQGLSARDAEDLMQATIAQMTHIRQCARSGTGDKP